MTSWEYDQAFKYAYKKGHTDIMNALFNYINKNKIFHFACEKSDLALAKKLVDDIAVEDWELDSVCYHSSFEIISFLMTKIDITKYDKALVLACSAKRTDVVKMFVDNGANPNVTWGIIDEDGDWIDLPLLQAAAHKSSIEIVKSLLDSPILDRKILHNALHEACMQNRADIVQLLLEEGGYHEYARGWTNDPHIKQLLLEWKFRAGGEEYQQKVNQMNSE